MNKKLILPLYLLTAFIMISCNQEAVPQNMLLSKNWTLTQVNSNRIVDTALSVPTTVQSDLHHKGEIPDPFVANNEADIQWVSNEDWQYSTTFQVSEEQLKMDYMFLTFDGLNTYATVELNGTVIHENDNAFVKSRLYVKELLKKTNKLKVTFHATTPFEKAANEAHPYTLPLVNAEHNDRVFTRKGQFEYGWDWGPIMNTMGFSRPVYLEIYNGFKVKEVYVKQESLTDSLAVLSAQVELEEAVSYGKMDFEVLVNGETAATVHYAGNKTKAGNFQIPFQIVKPKKWWPHNLGDPYLYDIKVIAVKDGSLKDIKTIRKGLRTTELITEKDAIGESFFIKINGVPVYAKGANYIPQNNMQNRVTDADYDRILSAAKEANMNFVRVWGGGNYERDIFYELCDEKGLLVWQDFMFACAMYPGDKRFRESVTLEAEQQVKRLRNHASIALFNGNNEINEAWHNWGWQTGRSEVEKDYIWEEYQTIFNGVLPTAVTKYSDLPYWESSPKYGRGDKRYETQGNAHDWWVWHSEYPFEHFENVIPRFSSEFGFQSHPSYEAVRYINKDGKLDIETKDYATHQKHPRGNALIKEYMKRDFPVPSASDDYVYVSQLLQSYGIGKAMYAQRKARPRSMGTIYWQLNDCWPVVSWSSIDYFGNWKALQYEAQRAFANLITVTSEESGVLNTFIVNDGLKPKLGLLKLKVIDFYGKVLFENESALTVDAQTSRLYMTSEIAKHNIDYSKVYIETTINDYKHIEFLKNPKSLKLPKGTIDIQTEMIDGGYQVTLTSTVFQKDVFLYSNRKGHFTDNFFNLQPGEKKVLTFKTKDKAQGRIDIKTLNQLM